jgi:drug/metabolite transporter (DMT)-like permease
LLIGVAGHGLMVFAQKTIAIGTIGVSSVIQPALAVVWSFLLLSEGVRGWQMVGITVAIVGLGAFLAFNERGERSRRAEAESQPPLIGADPDATGSAPGVRPIV